MKLKKLIATAGLVFSLSLFFGLSANAADGTTLETATTLTLNGTAHKNGMTEENCNYWYKCTLPSDIGNQWVVFSCTNNLSDMVYFTIYDENETMVDSFSLTTDESKDFTCQVPDSIYSEYFPVVEPGKTYYIQAEGYITEPSTKKYSLQVKTIADDNWGTLEQAPEIPIGQKKSGTLELYGDIDCYKFTVPEIPEGTEQIYTLSFAGSYNCTASFFDANEMLIDSIAGYSYENFSENKEITLTEGGTYYIKISDADFEMKKTSYLFKLTKGQSSETLHVAQNANDDGTQNANDSTQSTPSNNTSSLKPIKMLLVKAKKKDKKISIVSLKKAKYTVSINRKIIKNGKKKVKKLKKTVASGTLIVKLTKKLKKGDVIKVTVSKSGYKTKKKTVKIK